MPAPPADRERIRSDAARAVTSGFEMGLSSWYEVATQGRCSTSLDDMDSDLPHWLLWEVGCRDGRCLNRDEPSHGLKWRKGLNVEHILRGAQRLASWRPFVLERAPSPYDILILGSGTSRIACLFAGADGRDWMVITDSSYGGRRTPGIAESVVRLIGERVVVDRMERIVQGWIDVAELLV